jgi:acetyl esterase/lipase
MAMPVPGLDFPLTTAQPDFSDLAYACVSPAQKLDLYLPQGKSPFPLVLIVHGGAFMLGDKADQLSKQGTDHLLEHGYAVANVNYRLSGEARAPAQIQDVKTAVRWLRAHAGEYSLDPQRVGAWGSSAGGNLVALLGTSAGVPVLEGGELGCAGFSSQVQAVVDWFGPTDFLLMDRQLAAVGWPASHDASDSPESLLIGAAIQTRPDLARLVNPIPYVTAQSVPFLIQHGKCDNLVPFQQSQLLYEALVAAIGPARAALDLIEGAGHGGGPQFWAPSNVARVLSFLDQYLK